MIIKTGSISAGDGLGIVNYAVSERNNERVDVLKNQNSELLISDEFAKLRGRKNGLLHIVIAPGQELTTGELKLTIEAIREEFGFNPGDPETLAMHQSKRADGSIQQHYHLIRPAAECESGRTYKLFRSKAKDEAASRLCELQFGLQLTSGANNTFAEMRLREQGKHELADNLAAQLGNERSHAAYSSADHQQAKRQNFDLPALHQSLKKVAEVPCDQQPAALAELLDHLGLKLADAVSGGRGRSRINIELPNDLKPHNANRTLKIKPADVVKFTNQTKEKLHDLRSTNTAASRSEHSRSAIADHRGPNENSREQPGDNSTPERSSKNPPGDHKELMGEAGELAQAARELKPTIQRFVKQRTDDPAAGDLEAPPDPRDPKLLIKLSRILRKQLLRAAASMSGSRSGSQPQPPSTRSNSGPDAPRFWFF